ncbi:MAG: hypothetical protein Q4G21_04020 [Dermabacter sp.]|nr:hypothetical protein [Dermabacter sp.]
MRRLVDTCHLTITREKTSRTNATYVQPACVLYVRQIGHPQLIRRGRDELPLHLVFGSLALSTVTDGGRAGLFPHDLTQAFGTHEPFDGAPCHGDAFTVEFGVGLPGTVDIQVRFVSGLDVCHQLGIARAAR